MVIFRKYKQATCGEKNHIKLHLCTTYNVFLALMASFSFSHLELNIAFSFFFFLFLLESASRRTLTHFSSFYCRPFLKHLVRLYEIAIICQAENKVVRSQALEVNIFVFYKTIAFRTNQISSVI